MVFEIIGASVTVATAVGGVVVWLVRQEGKINVLDARLASTEKRVDGLEERIFDALTRIENLLHNKADKP